MFNTRIIQSVIAFVVGLFMAIWLGLNIVTDQTQTIIKIIFAVLFLVCFALGRRIWMLIPFAASLAIGLRIPGQPDALLLAQIAFIAFSIPQFLMRKLPWRLEFTELEFWMLMLTLMVAQVYMRNPVGMSIFGGDIVGGKGYVLYAIALTSALILCGLRVPASDLKWIMRLSIVGGLMNLLISIMGVLVPAIGFYTGQTYTRSDEVNYENREAIDTTTATRIGFLTQLGGNLSLWINCYISPLIALVKPLWLMLILVSVGASLMGGFRNGIMIVGLTFLLGIAYHSGGIGVLLSSFMGMIGVALLAAINLLAPLPPNVQRALTFLPGTWEERYKVDAKSSTEWRVEVWKEALLTNRWIQNKWLGDGLGFSAAELAAQMNDRKGARAGISGFSAHREAILANGDYHSGPVSSIRVIGYIGLLVFLLAQIRLAVHAHHLITRYRHTEWFPLTLLIGIPIIILPLVFVFIFGSFKNAAPTFLISCGLVSILKNNLPLPNSIRAMESARMNKGQQKLPA
ncbi:MAG: hypothetical protein B9S30_06510 [Verrucomicrobiia bacterium Tous-C5FEB]|nr:MAG: hypothetical protein B9S30_06510 [Verrucomicrobiae bacterium Tous-C5FEB]